MPTMCRCSQSTTCARPEPATAKVVDVIDPATGTVRLKAKVADADEMALDTRSSKTVRIKK